MSKDQSWERITKLAALIALLASSFAINLNQSMVQIAGPFLLEDFKVDYSALTWIFNGYQIAYAVLLPVFGAIGDKKGRKKTLLMGLIVFSVGSLLCGMAWDYRILVFFRVVQALGAAAVFPNGLVSGANFFPHDKRGRFMGIWGMSMSLGQVAGPSIGGFIVEFVGWRYIFFANFCCVVIALVVIGLLVKDDKPESVTKEPFDLSGTLLLGIAVLTLVMTIVYGAEYAWISPLVLGLASICFLTIPLFIRNESRNSNPIVDLKLFKSKTFLAGTYCGGVHLIAIQSSNMMLPLFLSGVQNLGAIQIGMIMLSLPLIRLVMSPLSGVISDKYGSVIPVSIGLVARSIALLGLSFITLTTSRIWLVILLLMDGSGASLIWAPTFKAVLEDTPAEKASSVTGTFNMLRLIMSVVGMVIVGILLDHYNSGVVVDQRFTPGFFHAYGLLSILTASGLFVVKNLGVSQKKENLRQKKLMRTG